MLYFLKYFFALYETDIVLSICHSDASYSKGKEAKDLGVTNITHLFNAMTPLNHRNPGIVGSGHYRQTTPGGAHPSSKVRWQHQQWQRAQHNKPWLSTVAMVS